MPFESAQVLLAGLRSQAVKEFFDTGDVAFLGDLLGEVDPGGIESAASLAREVLSDTPFSQFSVGVLLSPLSFAVDTEKRYGGTNAEQNHKCKGKRGGRSKRAVAPAPTPSPFRDLDWPGANRLVVEKPDQVLRQLRCCGVAARGFLFETFETDRFEIARNGGVQRAR